MIGVEHAPIFSALDVVMTLIEPRASVLDFIDTEVLQEFTHELRDRHVQLSLGSPVTSMIFSSKTRRLLGCHIVGEGATELIHIGQAVLNLKGTIDFFIENPFDYPTLAGAYKVAGLDARNRMARAWCHRPFSHGMGEGARQGG